MKVLAIGPYVGDFENELLQFRPYCRWLTEVIKWDSVYISTHINRMFLYDFIPKENIIPIFQQFSRDERNQKDHIHKKVKKKDFDLITKVFKDEIIERENCTKRDIEFYNLSYTISSPQHSIYKKIFEVIPNVNLDIPEEHNNKIVFIPAKQEKLEKLAYIYDWLKNNHDVVIIGSTDTWFSNDNLILNKIDYFENGFKYCIQYIMKSKCVITPLSYWTIIANLQNKNVFSWGENPGQYREKGIYNFGNKKYSIIPSDVTTSPDIIIRSIDGFLKK